MGCKAVIKEEKHCVSGTKQLYNFVLTDLNLLENKNK